MAGWESSGPMHLENFPATGEAPAPDPVPEPVPAPEPEPQASTPPDAGPVLSDITPAAPPAGVELASSDEKITKPLAWSDVPAAPSRPARQPLGRWLASGAIVAGVALFVTMAFMLRPKAKPARHPVDLGPPPAKAAAAPNVAPAPMVVAAPVAAAAPASKPADVSAPAPLPAAPSAPPPEEPAEPAKPVARWAFEGRVYDVINLHGVYAAELVFKDESGNVGGEATTGDEGRYRVFVPALSRGGYALSVTHPDYEKFIDEISPPFKELPEADRRTLINASKMSRPWIGKTDKTTRRDFVMVPKFTPQPDAGD